MTYKVLIMEDDFDLVVQWGAAFAEAGVEVTKSSSCSEAEAILASERFDALVTDIFIRDGEKGVSNEGGLLLIGHVRNPSLGHTPEWAMTMPIIAVTAAQSSPVTLAKHAPVFDPLSLVTDRVDLALRKPFGANELVMRVMALIEGRNDAHGEGLEPGP